MNTFATNMLKIAWRIKYKENVSGFFFVGWLYKLLIHKSKDMRRVSAERRVSSEAADSPGAAL